MGNSLSNTCTVCRKWLPALSGVYAIRICRKCSACSQCGTTNPPIFSYDKTRLCEDCKEIQEYASFCRQLSAELDALRAPKSKEDIATTTSSDSSDYDSDDPDTEEFKQLRSSLQNELDKAQRGCKC